MRRKITVIGDSETAAVAALALARREVADILLIGGREGLVGDLEAAAQVEGFAPWVAEGDWVDAAGSSIVIAAAVPDGVAEQLAARCPGAIVVVATADPAADVRALLDGTRFPRGRILGAAGAGAGPLGRGTVAAALADAVLRDRGRELTAAVLCRPDDDQFDGVEERTVRVGAGGVERILGRQERWPGP
jgi:malate/lactate dehydrogenase